MALYSWQTQFVSVVYKHEDSYKQTDRRACGAAASSNLTTNQRSVNSTLLSHYFCLLYRILILHEISDGFLGWVPKNQRILFGYPWWSLAIENVPSREFVESIFISVIGLILNCKNVWPSTCIQFPVYSKGFSARQTNIWKLIIGGCFQPSENIE